MGTSFLVQNTGRDTGLVKTCVRSLRASLNGDPNSEHQAFLEYLNRISNRKSNQHFQGKFIVVKTIDDSRQAYFIYPKKLGPNGNSRKTVKAPGDISRNLIKIICETCNSVSIEFVREDTPKAISFAESMGRVGSCTPIGKIVEVIR